MSNILVYGSIFENFRNAIHGIANSDVKLIKPFFQFLSGLIVCMMCTSTWVGFFMSLFFSPFTYYYGLHPGFGIFFDGMLASGGVWALNAIIEWFEENRK
ncbi:hypothetical protein N9I92_00255 [bacterium]|nr:hypothetical protein [bacterium]